MTTPTPEVKPTNYKTIVATIGSLVIAQLPLILQFLGHLPPPWGVVFSAIGSILAAFTGAGTYQAQYRPPGTVLVPESTVELPPPPTTPPTGGFTNPFRPKN